MNKYYTTLPPHIIPSHYSLRIEPDFTHFHFSGQAAITIAIEKSSSVIRLHAKELEIHRAVVVDGNKEYEAVVRHNTSQEQVALQFPQQLRGKVQLILTFQGIHHDKMYGFYHSRYRQHGKEQHLLTTQFEAANARAAFPCFDEPALKATFEVTLIIPQRLTAISNMPIQETQVLPSGKKRVVFSRTRRMPTYLLYMGVGNFKAIHTMLGKVTLSVITTPDKIRYARLPLQYAKTFLTFFEQYFRIPYPLPKLDMIAIPDFASGAMENWGAITFREIALLGDKNTSVFVKQNIAITLAHELAHQWFGNLVTMGWWDDLWLNESFATFMSYKAVHAAFPAWELPLQYFEDTIADALNADQMLSTHPINVRVKTPGEVDEIFDRISYDKGGSVLHMVEDYVGRETFRKGLTAYLHGHAYANATKDDLWNSLKRAHHQALLPAIVHSWITQAGYPVVKVVPRKNGYVLQQRRFTVVPNRSMQRWRIPLTYEPTRGRQKRLLLASSPLVITSIFKLNAGQAGFYRAEYDRDHLRELGECIQQRKVGLLDAAGIEDDFYSLMLAGKYTLREYLTFVERYCLHADYPLNGGISNHLGALFFLLSRHRAEGDVRRISLIFHQGLLQQLGWERKSTEKNTATMLRSMAISSLGILGERTVLQEAARKCIDVKRGKAVDANIRGVVYSLAAWQGNRETFSYLLTRYRKEKIPEENRKLLRALGMFRQEMLQKKALELSQSKVVRLQDSIMLPMTIAGNPAAGEEMLWSWTKKNWRLLQQRYSSGAHMLPYIVHNLSGSSSRILQREIKTFFSRKQHQRDDIKQAIRQTLERIEVNVRFLERVGKR